MAIELPQFQGFTVDTRLQQFRKADLASQTLEFIKFDSPKGSQLLNKFQAQCDHKDTKYHHGFPGYEAMICQRCGKNFPLQ